MGVKNMKYKPLRSATIFFTTTFYRPGWGHGPLASPGPATDTKWSYVLDDIECRYCSMMLDSLVPFVGYLQVSRQDT